MPERLGVRVRNLPDGEFRDALQIAFDGRFLELDLKGQPWSLGAALEIERGSILYWGELRQCTGSTALIRIEHSLDSSRLQPLRETWGN